MDILNSGSFVPLDNREKIEQLIFTAKTLATEVSRTDGFQSDGSTNHQLGLEMWKGAEYMCRAHEEATIRNLFLSKFLEKLREVERQNGVQHRTVQTAVLSAPPAALPEPIHSQVQTHTNPLSVLVQPPSPEVVTEREPQDGRDEYLGVISEDAVTEIGRPSYAEECVPEGEAEIVAMKHGAATDEFIAASANIEEYETAIEATSVDSEPKESQDPVVTQVDNTEISEVKESDTEPAVVEPDTAELPTPVTAAGIDSIVLSEKEPYDFDSCTITAVIQLLPQNNRIRKCVVSVKSHDFVPQIAISDLRNGDINEDIKRCLETAIGQYRTNLPVLAAERIKKQKLASKKRTSKAEDKVTKVESVSGEKATVVAPVPPLPESSEATKDQQNLFAS
ncbi:MAG: hypothetical protein H0V76_00125 [Blastocatellia bacterium]|nr:hypothetical protein [Blastocatellia bacterium]